MEDNKKSEKCCQISFRSLYQEYENLFGIFGSPVLEIPHHLENTDNDGYIVNKDLSELIKRKLGEYGQIAFLIFDHIRTINELITGLFKTDNKEFHHIIREFIFEFMMDEVYIIYSKEVNSLEQILLDNAIKETHEDALLRRKKAKFNSNYRLFKRESDATGKQWTWKSVLTGVSGITLSEEIEDQLCRATFNEGFFFLRLFRIFSNYESQMQTYIRAFKILHKIIYIRGTNSDTIKRKINNELLTAGVEIIKSDVDLKDSISVKETEIFKQLPHLETSYHVIQLQLNDSLAKLGLGGDDSTKCERITTGENFRALQPNSAFQQTILLELNKVGTIIKETFNQELKFELALQPGSGGVPAANKNNITNNATNNRLQSED